MGNAPSFDDLKSLSLEELKRRHDQAAEHTLTGVNYYLSEISRREQDESNRVMLELTKNMHDMTVRLERVTYLALWVAVTSMFITIAIALATR